jgi:hypothetical protein
LLRHIANYHRDPSLINRLHLRLLKLTITHAPALKETHLQPSQTLRLCLQIRVNGTLCHSTALQEFRTGEAAKFGFQDHPIILADDCLFSIKYGWKDKMYPVARIQINTNFVFTNSLRVQQQ